MKKFSIISILVVLTLTFVFCFVGCTNTPDTPNSTDLSNYEVGHKFAVYPTVEFNYKINDDFIVHISSISATLVKKNEIKENDTIEGRYNPYTTKFEVSGYTDAKHSGKQLNISITTAASTILHTIAIATTIGADGTFYVNYETNTITKNDIIYFARVD